MREGIDVNVHYVKHCVNCRHYINICNNNVLIDILAVLQIKENFVAINWTFKVATISTHQCMTDTLLQHVLYMNNKKDFLLYIYEGCRAQVTSHQSSLLIYCSPI